MDVDPENTQLGDLLNNADVEYASPTGYVINGRYVSISVTGTDFTYDDRGAPVSGTVTSLSFAPYNSSYMKIDGINVDQSVLHGWVASNDIVGALSTLLSGHDFIDGYSANQILRGYGGNDALSFFFPNPGSMYGGQGDDSIGFHSPGLDRNDHYLRGDEGNDSIQGADGFDDINGNMGDDSLRGGQGNDWVVGGKDQDVARGEVGDDIVYGNLGDDTLNGEQGTDLVRGGQGDDVVMGGDADDWLSGDLGSDTLTGGAGADIFHTFAIAGMDRVTDFNAAAGDRVQVDQGSSYTLSQQGADTVIDFGGGNAMVLAGVQLNSLQSDWIFTAPA